MAIHLPGKFTDFEKKIEKLSCGIAKAPNALTSLSIDRKRHRVLSHKNRLRLKVAYTSGPIFEKIMKRYPIFSVQIINYQIDQKHK